MFMFVGQSRQMYDMYREAYFNEKMFTKELNMVFLRWPWIKKTVHGVETLVKEKFREQLSVKKVMLKVFWGKKRVIIIDFLEKGTTLSNASNYQLLRQNLPYLVNDPSLYNISTL